MNHHFSSKGFSTAFECIEYILKNTQESSIDTTERAGKLYIECEG